MTKLEEAALMFAKADRVYEACPSGDFDEARRSSMALYEAANDLHKAAHEFADQVAEDRRNPDEDDRPGLG